MIWKIMQTGKEPNYIVLNFCADAEKIASFCGVGKLIVRMCQIWRHNNLIEVHLQNSNKVTNSYCQYNSKLCAKIMASEIHT